MRKKIGIFTWHDLANAYSCLLYLGHSLRKYGVDIWAKSNAEDILPKYRDMIRSFYSIPFGKIRGIRLLAARVFFLFAAKKYDTIIINDVDFFFTGYLLKKIYPRKTIIHYNTEIYGGNDIVYSRLVGIIYNFELKFYNKHAGYPDLLIDCLKERAEYRKKQFGIQKEIYTINNTVPEEDITELCREQNDVSDYFNFKSPALPVAIYAGGCQLTRNLGDIIQSAPLLSDKVNFLLLCYGTDEEMKTVRQTCEGLDNCRVHEAVDKKTLIHIMRRCDIGLQYYDPHVSVNHYYASPSKFYEYIGNGLNVVSSENRGIDRMIEDNNLGILMKDGETVAEGIIKLLEKGLAPKDRIQKVFREKLCYEIDSIQTLNAICSMINTRA